MVELIRTSVRVFGSEKEESTETLQFLLLLLYSMYSNN